MWSICFVHADLIHRIWELLHLRSMDCGYVMGVPSPSATSAPSAPCTPICSIDFGNCDMAMGSCKCCTGGCCMICTGGCCRRCNSLHVCCTACVLHCICTTMSYHICYINDKATCNNLQQPSNTFKHIQQLNNQPHIHKPSTSFKHVQTHCISSNINYYYNPNVALHKERVR